ncbi:MAG: uroporphyrinogen-III synthase [Methanosarcinaceae archaeon]|nr:uroporphyrinogen-III synthase [Methanosarcinaceae archaeon]
MKVAVTRLREKEDGTVELFKRYGLEAVPVPTIRSCPPHDPASLESLVEMVTAQKIDFLIFTSTLGVSKFFEKSSVIPAGITILSVGPKTARKVNDLGCRSEMLDSFSSDNFAEHLKDRASGSKIGIARAGVPDKELIFALESLGATVVEGICYELESVPNDLKDMILDQTVDAVIFTSAKSFLASGLEKKDVGVVITVAIGPKTANSMLKKGVEPNLVGSGTLESCAALLKELYINKKKE